MIIVYSEKCDGFFNDQVHAKLFKDGKPIGKISDGIILTEDEYKEIFAQINGNNKRIIVENKAIAFREKIDDIDIETIKQKRNKLIDNVEWEYKRNDREKRLNLTPSRDEKWMKSLDEYIQKLTKITDKLAHARNVVWPIQPK